MPNPSDPTAKVYAQALMELAQDETALGAIYDDLREVRRFYDQESWFRAFFTSPRVDREVKWNAIREAFEGQVGRPVLGLMKVMIQRGRESLLDNVADQFERYKDLRENRVHVQLTVASALDAHYRDDLRRRLEAATGRNIQIHETVDPSVIGGARLRAGDNVIDHTLSSRLRQLRKHLLARGN